VWDAHAAGQCGDSTHTLQISENMKLAGCTRHIHAGFHMGRAYCLLVLLQTVKQYMQGALTASHSQTVAHGNLSVSFVACTCGMALRHSAPVMYRSHTNEVNYQPQVRSLPWMPRVQPMQTHAYSTCTCLAVSVCDQEKQSSHGDMVCIRTHVLWLLCNGMDMFTVAHRQ
jgi:hypothetical protein